MGQDGHSCPDVTIDLATEWSPCPIANALCKPDLAEAQYPSSWKPPRKSPKDGCSSVRSSLGALIAKAVLRSAEREPERTAHQAVLTRFSWAENLLLAVEPFRRCGD